jgi:hypothetical protein
MSDNRPSIARDEKTEDMRRKDLHGALDALLDAQAEESGALDAAAFWTFVALLTEGGGIAAEIEEGAALMLAEHGMPKKWDELWRAWQWAVVFKLLQRLEAPARFGLADGVLPESFMPAAIMAVAVNRIQPGGKGDGIDLLGMKSGRRGPEQTLVRAARRLLVLDVMQRAIQSGHSEDETRRRHLPGDLPNRTWVDWKREAAKAKGFAEIEPLRASIKAAIEAGAPCLSLPRQEVEDLWRIAFRPNPVGG